MPSKNWKLLPHVSEEFCQRFSEFSTLGAQLLYNRGLNSKEEVARFIYPKYEELHDPFLFQDMEKAVERIWRAIDENQGICIYGDYDADAVTANAVLQQTFSYLGVEVDNYIPDRFTEGYGLNLEAFEKIRARGCNLIITVDCGTNSVEVAEWCKQNKIDLIITDHHEVIGELPDAYALINPKNAKDTYPYPDITGVGVAFKLACGILSDKSKVAARFEPSPSHPSSAPSPRGRGKYVDGYEKWLLDLVAIGTVADCHSLLGENRILVKYGLKVLAKTRWTGLRSLCNIAGLDFTAKPSDTYTLGFIIAPRLNAAGRLEHASIALNLLMEKDPGKAVERAQNLDNLNQRRQEYTKRILSEAKEQVELLGDRKVIIISKEEWSKGVVGLVAGKLVEEYQKPVMVLAREGAEATGSARTVGDFDVVESLKHASEYLVRFGGHQQAAGLTVRVSQFEQFYQKVLEYADRHLSTDELTPHLTLEAELTAEHLNLETLKLLEAFEPFGVGNTRPKFLLSNLQILQMRAVGVAGQHIQLRLQKDNTEAAAIAFNMGFLAQQFKIGDNIDAAVELMEDGWRGRKDIKLRVVDVKTSSENF